MIMARIQKSMPVKEMALRTALYFVVSVICIVILYPYFVMVCTALKSRAEIFSINGSVLPQEALWSNFVDIWQKAPMAQYMLNSLMIAGGSTLIAMLCGIPAAYALARMKFKGQTAFLGFIIVSQMFAPVVLLIGIYKVMQSLALTNSVIGLIFIMAWTRLQPSMVAACSISAEMDRKVPRSSQIVKAWLNAALMKIRPQTLLVRPRTDITL